MGSRLCAVHAGDMQDLLEDRQVVENAVLGHVRWDFRVLLLGGDRWGVQLWRKEAADEAGSARAPELFVELSEIEGAVLAALPQAIRSDRRKRSWRDLGAPSLGGRKFMDMNVRGTRGLMIPLADVARYYTGELKKAEENNESVRPEALTAQEKQTIAIMQSFLHGSQLVGGQLADSSSSPPSPFPFAIHFTSPFFRSNRQL